MSKRARPEADAQLYTLARKTQADTPTLRGAGRKRGSSAVGRLGGRGVPCGLGSRLRKRLGAEGWAKREAGSGGPELTRGRLTVS